MTRLPGFQFLQIPGPTNVPQRVAAAMARPLLDHRGAEFAAAAREALAGLAEIFGTRRPIALFPSSGTGAWQAALVNCLAPRDRVLVCENGFFALQWARLAERLGFDVSHLFGDWRRSPDPDAIGEALSADSEQAIKAVLVVHSETSTGALTDIAAVRAAIDAASHPALLLVDTISSLGSVDYRHDEWRVDVSVGCSQKGLMLPPGIGLNAVSSKAMDAYADAPRAGYFEWSPALEAAQSGMFPYTPPTSLVAGLLEALTMLREEGLEFVYARHARHAAATHAAVEAWGLEVYPVERDRRSPSLTAALVRKGDAQAVLSVAGDRFGLSLGAGLDRLRGDVFRIGHLGDFNDLMLAATLSGVELTLAELQIGTRGGVEAALDVLAEPTPALLGAD